MPGALDLGECIAHLRERVPDAIVTNGAGNFTVVGAPLLALARLSDAARADERRDGVRRPGRRRGEARRARADGRLLRGRRRLPDERAGARDGGAVRPADRRARREQRHVRDDSHAPGAELSLGASSAPISSIPISPRTRARSARTGRRSTETAQFADALERALDRRPACAPRAADRSGGDQPAHDAHEAPRGRAAMSGREEIRVPGQAEPISHYTDAVRAGDLLFVSGCVPVDARGRLVGGDVVAQARQVFANIGAVLDGGRSDVRRRRQGDRLPHGHRRPRADQPGAARGVRRRRGRRARSSR